MSRPTFALALAFLVPLAATAAAAPPTFASLEEFARAIGMKPGGWHLSLKVTATEVELPPGTDPAIAAGLKAALTSTVGSVQERDECAGMTPEGPKMPGILIGGGCSFSRIEGGDGRWALESTCPQEGPEASATISAQGTYGAETVTASQDVAVAHNGVVVRVKSDIAGRYTGECRPPFPPASVAVSPPKR